MWILIASAKLALAKGATMTNEANSLESVLVEAKREIEYQRDRLSNLFEVSLSKVELAYKLGFVAGWYARETPETPFPKEICKWNKR
jgi:hypothetical protein